MSEAERKKPFTTIEKNLFLNIIKNYEDIVRCKNLGGVWSTQKKEAWEEIQKIFNSSPLVSQKATRRQLTRLWYNLNHRASIANKKSNVFNYVEPIEVVNFLDVKSNNIFHTKKENVDSDSDDISVRSDNENDGACSEASRIDNDEKDTMSNSGQIINRKNVNTIRSLKVQILEEELRHKQEINKEELLIKIKEREFKEKMWELELKIKEKQMSQE